MKKIFFVGFFFFLIFLNSIYAEYPYINRGDVITSHFWIKYEKASTPDYADSTYVNNVATIVEEVWTYLKGQGYKNPLHVPDNPVTSAEKLQISITNRPVGQRGGTTPVGKDGIGIPEIGIDNNYTELGWGTAGLNTLRLTLIHEILHAVEQSYANFDAYQATTLDWFWEGGAAWIQDESVILLGINIDTLNDYNVASNRAELFMNTPQNSLSSRKYDAVLFWKYFAEKGNSVKSVLEYYDTLNPALANNEDMLNAMTDAVGGADNLRNLYDSFSIACFVKNGPNGFSDDGAKDLPDVNIYRVYDSSLNTHYVAGLPNVIGQKIIDCNDTIDNFPQTIDGLPRLSAHYIKYEIPEQINNPTKLKTRMFSHVDGSNKFNTTDIYWGANICAVNNEIYDSTDPSKSRKFITGINLNNADRKNISSSFEIGGDTTNDNKEIYLIVANLEGADSINSSYKHSSVIIPVLQESYVSDTTAGIGSTKTVKNLDSDNIYKKGDTANIEIDVSGEVDLAGIYTIEPQFNLIDSKYDTSRLLINGGGINHKYNISYKLSDDNVIQGKDIVLPIKIYDLTKQDYNVDTTFKVTIDYNSASVEVKNSKGVVISNGNFTNDTTINIFVDDSAVGSGIDKLEIRKDDYDTGAILFQDTTDYGTSHVYESISIGAQGDGKICLKVWDKAQNVAIRDFILDILCPNSITNFTAQSGDSTAILSWKIPNDSDFAGVKVVRQNDTLAVYEGNNTTFTDTGLVNDQKYFYTICAYDGAGNYSDKLYRSAIPHRSPITLVFEVQTYPGFGDPFLLPDYKKLLSELLNLFASNRRSGDLVSIGFFANAPLGDSQHVSNVPISHLASTSNFDSAKSFVSGINDTGKIYNTNSSCGSDAGGCHEHDGVINDETKHVLNRNDCWNCHAKGAIAPGTGFSQAEKKLGFQHSAGSTCDGSNCHGSSDYHAGCKTCHSDNGDTLVYHSECDNCHYKTSKTTVTNANAHADCQTCHQSNVTGNSNYHSKCLKCHNTETNYHSVCSGCHNNNGNAQAFHSDCNECHGYTATKGNNKKLVVFSSWNNFTWQSLGTGAEPKYLKNSIETKLKSKKISVTGIDYTNLLNGDSTVNYASYLASRATYQYNASRIEEAIDSTGGSLQLFPYFSGTGGDHTTTTARDKIAGIISNIVTGESSPYLKKGERYTRSFNIENGLYGLEVSIWGNKGIKANIYNQNGVKINPETDPGVRFYNGNGSMTYSVSNPIEGIWQLEIDASELLVDSTKIGFDVLARGSLISMESEVPEEINVGETKHITVRIKDKGASIAVSKVYLEIGDYNKIKVDLYDDGLHGDGFANDRVYGCSLNIKELEGSQEWVLRAEGLLTKDDGLTSKWEKFASGKINFEGRAPISTIISPKKNTVIPNGNIYIEADIKDDVQVKNIVLKLDSTNIYTYNFDSSDTSNYNPTTGKLKYLIPYELTTGEHTVNIQAIDNMGVSAPEAWKFRVAGGEIVTDASGDYKGRGTLIYPSGTAEISKPKSDELDIVRFDISTSYECNSIGFNLKVNLLSEKMADLTAIYEIYIDTDFGIGSGKNELFSGVNAKLKNGKTWEYKIRIAKDEAYLMSSNGDKTSLTATINPNTKIISINIPYDYFINSIGPVQYSRDWGYAVISMAYHPYATNHIMPVNLMTKVGAFGGGDDGNIDPNIVDLCRGDWQSPNQTEILNSFDIPHGKLAEIPLIIPGNWNEIQDVTKPVISYVKPTGIVAEKRPEVSFEVYEEGWLDSVTVKLDGQEITNHRILILDQSQISDEESYMASIGSDLADGNHTIDVKAKDRVGNIGERSWNFEVVGKINDSIPPVALIIQPVDGTVLAGDIVITGTVFDENINYYTLYYGEVASPEKWIEIVTVKNTNVDNGILGVLKTQGLKDGAYKIRLIAVDRGYNSSFAGKTILQ